MKERQGEMSTTAEDPHGTVGRCVGAGCQLVTFLRGETMAAGTVRLLPPLPPPPPPAATTCVTRLAVWPRARRLIFASRASSPLAMTFFFFFTSFVFQLSAICQDGGSFAARPRTIALERHLEPTAVDSCNSSPTRTPASLTTRRTNISLSTARRPIPRTSHSTHRSSSLRCPG